MFNKYPYTDFHELNLDWILETITKLNNDMETFVNVSAIKYADPLQWDISSQYEQNTLVQDNAGNTYLSKKPVPKGISLSNNEYWLKVADFDSAKQLLKNAITSYDEGTGTTATEPHIINDLVWLSDILYKITAPMIAGDSYIEGSNCEKITIAELIKIERDERLLIESELFNNISTETTNRINADNLLSNRIDAETEMLKNKQYINVKDFGAAGDGIMDDTQFFKDCISFVGAGGKIIVPSGTYLLNENPNPTNIPITFLNDNNVSYIGDGIGDPSSYAGTFNSPLTNPGNIINGTNSVMNIDNAINPVGNGVTSSSEELNQSDNTDYIILNGSISSGTFILTLNSTEGIDRGDGIILNSPIIEEWPNGTTRANTMRVVSVLNDTQVSIGPDNSNGNGNAIATNWEGPSIANGSFTIRKRRWQVLKYTGIVGAPINPDRINWCHDTLMQINGCESNAYEIELDINANTEPICRGILLTGKGSANGQMAAIDIMRNSGIPSQNWKWGISINNAAIGANIKASQGIIIGTKWNNALTQLEDDLYTGIVFDNISEGVYDTRPLIAGKQIVNGSTGILLQRNTDVNNAGFFLQFMNSEANANLFTVDTNGICTAGIFKVIQNPTEDSTITARGYIIMQDANGNNLKVMIAN